MKKYMVPFLVVPLFLFGCGKNKNIYASSKNTIYEFKLDGDNAIITGLNRNYKNQTDIIIPYSIDKHVVKRIENYSFEDVYRIKNVDMSKSNLEEIGASTFKKCSNLSSIKLPKTIKNIEEKAFEDCDSLASIDLSNCNIETINNEVFLNCDSLTNISFPLNTKTIGSKIFSGCKGITEIDLSSIKVEEIGDYAFYNLENLKDVKLPNTTKKIGDYAFAEDKKIQKLELSSTQIEEIGEGAFSNCLLLANIFLPKTLKKLGKKTFYYCQELRKIDLLGTGVEEIPESCFELCKTFDSIKLPEIKTISSRAFYNSALSIINIPKTVTSISDDAFRLCKKLEEIRVDESNTNYIVYNGALHTINKEKLIVYPAASKKEEFKVSENTTIINSYAFAGAANLKTIDLTSARINEIAPFTFVDCYSLEEIKHYNDPNLGIKVIGDRAFYNCKSLKKFDGQHSITEIGESAFYDCTSLEELYLSTSTSLTKIDAEAFYNCNKLDILTLPASLEMVGRSAFYNCTNVTYFYFGANKEAFDNLVKKCEDSCLKQYEDFVH